MITRIINRGIRLQLFRGRQFSIMAQQQAPRVNKISPLSADEAKWTELRKIEWTDQTGKDRVWEAAARKTRKETGIDAVAIAPILRHPSKPPSTLIILQYRPPVEATCVEFPAGLIDAGETPEQAAIRELKEETGYEGKVCDITPVLSNQPGMTNATHQVLECSPTIVSDPGLTNANMQVCATISPRC
jgi:ADP-ribose pyrophosphatase